MVVYLNRKNNQINGLLIEMGCSKKLFAMLEKDLKNVII